MTDRERLLKFLNVPIYLHENVDPLEAVADFLLDNGVTFQKWIPISERLPEERDSIFKRFHGTKLWQDGMFLTVSNTVLASVLNEDGTRTVKAMHTQGGEWNLDSMPWAKCVTHWMPLPEPPKEDV